MTKSTMFKIVDWKNDTPHTLFHGVSRSRKLPFNKWITAEEKMVRDGSNQERYLSGFHVLPTVKDCLEYLKKFRNTQDKAIVRCWVRSVRRKERSPSPVYLAKEILILYREIYGIRKSPEQAATKFTMYLAIKQWIPWNFRSAGIKRPEELIS